MQTKGHGMKLQKVNGGGRIRLSLGIRIAVEKGEYQVTRLALSVARSNIASHVGRP